MSSMANSTPGDKTVNKVALCSAIFAGFAYVGYSVVRTAFCRKLGRREGEVYQDEHRLYFRRLSQTTQTDVLLGNLDLSGSGKVILRPMTVQERIRELNLQARMFTDTMLAIQATSGHSPRHLPGHRSLQCSPWSSPRILSPVDMRHILTSRSSENLPLLAVKCGDMIISSPKCSKRGTRRSMRSRAQSQSPEAYLDNSRESEVSKEKEQQLKINLDKISQQQREIPRHDAKSLVILLQSNDTALLERTLTTISNGATIPANQVTLREVGCLIRVQRLLTHFRPSVQLAAITALGNLSLNSDNQKELKDSLPVLNSILLDKPSEKLVLQTLATLTNIAVLSDWHDEFCPILHHLYHLVDTGPSSSIKLQALRVLVNLSCNDDMIPSLLAANAPKKLLHLLDMTTNEDILLRIVTLLANLTQGVRKLHIDPILDLPLEDKAPSPDTMYAAIFGINIQEKLCSKAFTLMSHHPNEDIRFQARKVVEALKP